ncbi:MAG: sensor histidine kinase, partial [Achromobacter piechaudii]
MFWPAAVLADGVLPSSGIFQLGLTAGAALACSLACALLWVRTRASIYGAGLAFAALEGVFRTLPTLLPPGALQAGSYAALLAVTAPLLAASSSAPAPRIASACRVASMVLACVAALALIFVYETENGTIPALIAALCAGLSVALTVWFAVQAATRRAGRPLALTLACVHAATAWMLGQDAWLSNGADT